MTRYAKTTLVIVGIAICAVAVQAVVLNDWQFDEASGTKLSDIDATGSDPATTSFSWNSTDITTDGSGMLRDVKDANYYGNAGITSIGSGLTWLQIEYDAWQIDGTDEKLGFGLRNSSGGNFFRVQIRKMTYANNVVLEVVADSTTTIHTFSGSSYSGGADIVVGLDITAGTFDLWWRAGSDDFDQVINDGKSLQAAGTAVDTIRIASVGDFSGAGEFVTVDRLFHASKQGDTGAAVPEATTLAMLGVGLLIVRALWRRMAA